MSLNQPAAGKQAAQRIKSTMSEERPAIRYGQALTDEGNARAQLKRAEDHYDTVRTMHHLRIYNHQDTTCIDTDLHNAYKELMNARVLLDGARRHTTFCVSLSANENKNP